VNQKESEQDEVDGMKEEAYSTGKVINKIGNCKRLVGLICNEDTWSS